MLIRLLKYNATNKGALLQKRRFVDEMWDSRSLQKIKSTETIKTTPPIYGPTK
jgi:hypothetical protein